MKSQKSLRLRSGQAPVKSQKYRFRLKTFAFCIVVLRFAFCALRLLPVFAQEESPQQALGVTPAILEEILTPGEKVRTKVTVVNPTNFPLPIKVLVSAFMPEEEIELSEQEKQIYDASSWIKILEPDFILQPKQPKEIQLEILASEGAEPGGHYATIFFQVLIPKEVLSPENLYISGRIGVLAFLIVSGEIEEKVKVVSFQAPQLSQFSPVNLSLKIKNEGNVHIRPSGKIVIENWQGKEIASLFLNEGMVLPGTTREFTQDFKKRILLGKYQAQTFISYGTEGKSLNSEKISFWVIPYLSILLTGAIIMCILRIRKRIGLAFKILLGIHPERG